MQQSNRTRVSGTGRRTTRASAQAAEIEEILTNSYQRAFALVDTPILTDPVIGDKVNFICTHSIGAACRVLLACLLAKIHQPQKDIRKPYKELGADAFSGRYYDEHFIFGFITQYHLPCMRTTGFLTPAFRTKIIVLTPDAALGGDSPELYGTFLEVIDAIYTGGVVPADVFAEAIRCLIIVRDKKDLQIQSLLAGQRASENKLPLSAEGIVNLIQRHLEQDYSSRLPVLVVAAAYQAAEEHLGERVLPLQRHNAADKQTGSLGDVEITLLTDNDVITCYEMKDKQVIRNDIEQAVIKISEYWRDFGKRVDNYIFITTRSIDKEAQDFAKSLYEQTGGTEFVILDCIGFLRHFLHLFHRLRLQFLEAYQNLVLAESESAVRHPLKVVFLALRQNAESGPSNQEEASIQNTETLADELES